MKKPWIILLIFAALSCKKDHSPKPPDPPDDRPLLSFTPSTIVSGGSVRITSLSDTIKFSYEDIIDILFDSIPGENIQVLDSTHLLFAWTPALPAGKVNVAVHMKTKTIRSSGLTVVERAKWAARTKPDSAIYSAVSFGIGSKGYVLTGSDSTYSYAIYPNEPITVTGHARNRFMEYDAATNSWKRLSDFPGGSRVAAAGFSIGNKAYIGTGTDFRGNTFSDFWSYDTEAGDWQQLPDLPAEARYSAVGFNVGNKGYIGTGISGTNVWLSDIWEFDPAGNSWKKMADFPGGGRYGAVGIGLGNNAYVGFGGGDPSKVPGGASYLTDLWQFTPGSNTWTRKADRRDTLMNIATVGRIAPTGFALNGKVYLGTGVDYAINSVPYNLGSSDFWEYDPAGDSWQLMDPSPIAAFGAFSFAIGNQAYIGGGMAVSGSASHSATSYAYNFFYQFSRVP